MRQHRCISSHRGVPFVTDGIYVAQKQSKVLTRLDEFTQEEDGSESEIFGALHSRGLYVFEEHNTMCFTAEKGPGGSS